MLPLARQIVAVTRINLLSLPSRRWISFSAVVAIAFVVFVLLGALALQQGFEKTLNGSGSDGVAIVLRPGATSEINSAISREQQQLIAAAPGIASVGGKPAVSNELYIVVDGIKKSTRTKSNLPLRGVNPAALAARKGVHVVQGRMFAPGSNELIVGAGVLKEFDGFALGQKRKLGANVWQVVGVFDAGGSVFESELWADLPVVQSLFNRGDGVQTIRARLTSPAAIKQLDAYNQADPRLKLDIKSEKAYFAAQAKGANDLIGYIGKPLAVIMAIGALAGALNTMYASVASRSGEIATLRTIGFGGLPTFVGTLVESLVLSICGALIGSIAAYVAFNGMTASTLGSNFSEVVFDLSLSTPQLVEGTIWATVLGLLGGIFPAWRAARQPILAAAE